MSLSTKIVERFFDGFFSVELCLIEIIFFIGCFNIALLNAAPLYSFAVDLRLCPLCLHSSLLTDVITMYDSDFNAMTSAIFFLGY